MRLAFKIFVFSVAFAFLSCNSDVFIDDFLQKSASLSVTEENRDATLKFNTDDWSLLDINSEYSNIFMEVTDLEGNFKALPFNNNEQGIVRCYNDYFELRIEKRHSRELQVIMLENLYDSTLMFSVKVGNQYAQKNIDINVGTMQKYRIDSVIYDWNKWKVFTNGVVLVDSLVVDNSKGTEPVSVTLYPYKTAERVIKLFYPNGVWEIFKEEYRKCLGIPLPQIVIPDLEGEHPILGDTRIVFGIEEQKLETKLEKNLEVKKNVLAGDVRKLMVYNGIDEYTVPYKVYVSHPITGRQRIFKGELQSKCPKDYLVIPEKVMQ